MIVHGHFDLWHSWNVPRTVPGKFLGRSWNVVGMFLLHSWNVALRAGLGRLFFGRSCDVLWYFKSIVLLFRKTDLHTGGLHRLGLAEARHVRMIMSSYGSNATIAQLRRIIHVL